MTRKPSSLVGPKQEKIVLVDREPKPGKSRTVLISTPFSRDNKQKTFKAIENFKDEDDPEAIASLLKHVKSREPTPRLD